MENTGGGGGGGRWSVEAWSVEVVEVAGDCTVEVVYCNEVTTTAQRRSRTGGSDKCRDLNSSFIETSRLPDEGGETGSRF